MSSDQREFQRTFYDRHYAKRTAAVRDQLAHPLFRSFYDRLAGRVYDHALEGRGDGRTVRVLEPGCGEGLLGAALQRVAGERGVDLHYTAGDLSASALALAREHVKGELHVGDAREVVARLTSDSQDVVVLKNLLHHLDDPAGLLREAARVAGRRGKVVIVEPRLGCPHIWIFNLLAPKRERHYFKGARRNVAAVQDAGLVLSRRERFTFLPYELAFVIRPGLFRRLFATADPRRIARVSALDDRLVAALPWLATYVLWVAVSAEADDGEGTKRS